MKTTKIMVTIDIPQSHENTFYAYHSVAAEKLHKCFA